MSVEYRPRKRLPELITIVVNLLHNDGHANQFIMANCYANTSTLSSNQLNEVIREVAE